MTPHRSDSGVGHLICFVHHIYRPLSEENPGRDPVTIIQGPDDPGNGKNK
jgi:hypothetical protein